MVFLEPPVAAPNDPVTDPIAGVRRLRRGCNVRSSNYVPERGTYTPERDAYTSERDATGPNATLTHPNATLTRPSSALPSPLVSSNSETSV